MTRFKLLVGIIGLLTIFGLASWGTAQETLPAPKNGAPLQNGFEVQTRGPIHEAFAQPFDVKPEAGPIVPKEPPPAINEMPPEQKPAADNAQWIPGYWSWDPERKDYVWVGGVYRVPPSNRQFVPGYWSNTPDGWRWVQGFWANPQQDVPYAPQPPATLDNGPQQPAPDDNSAYIPGNWVYRDNRFAWQPGYWSPLQQGRVWHPAQWMWTPNGWLFVNGYWDLPLDDRGLATPPVYFNQPLWNNPDWSYQPAYAVNPNAFFDSAFVNGPGFYFGNYYNPRYGGLGYNPWFAGRGRYDPLFANYASRNPNFTVGRVAQIYAGRSAGTLIAPPLTLAQQTTLVRTKNVAPVVAPFAQFNGGQARLVQATPAQVRTQQALAQQTRQLAANRRTLEAANVGRASGSVQSQSLRFAALNGPQSSGTRIVNMSPNVSSQGIKIVNQTPRGTGAANGPATTIRPATTVRPATTIRPATVPAAPARPVTPAVHHKVSAPVNVAPQVTHGPTVVQHNVATNSAARVVHPMPAPARVSAPVRTVSHTPARTTAARPAAARRR
jgi:hypothetical protein